MTTVLIGAMGINVFEDTVYEFWDGKSDISNYFIYSLSCKVIPDQIVILLTPKARERQWEGKDKLKDWFEGSAHNFKLIPVDIPNGGSEEESWEIFNKIAQHIPDESEILVDITNGIRSTPVLLLSAVRYLQYAKRATIKEIYYCAHDTVDKTDPKPVYQLSLFNVLLDWSAAVDMFKRTGNSVLLAELLERSTTGLPDEIVSQVPSILKSLSLSLDLIRPEGVMQTVAQLVAVLRQIDIQKLPLQTQPFGLLLQQVENGFKDFALQETSKPENRKEFIARKLKLVNWYIERSRYADAVLLTRELMITWWMWQYEPSSVDIFDHQVRNSISKKFHNDVTFSEL